jgi:crotonobetainyl-CoA:carnitine CoA-transferase CaiB-like acyl-CoA transferase
MPAFGLGGPWRDRVGFAQTIEQASGLASLTGHADGAPMIPNGMCDPLAGIHAALAVMVALVERDRTGRGQVLEAPMIGGALNTAAEQVIEHSAFGRTLSRMGNGSPLVEQAVLRCRGDDDWVAVSLPDEVSRTALAAAVGSAAAIVGGNPSDELRAWCAERSAAEVVETLWPHDIPVAPVLWAHQIVDNPQLRHRRFFEDLDHPVCGRHPYVSFPVRFSAGPAVWNRRPSPTLGQHNDEILTGLGLTPGEITALREREIVAERVVVGQRGW